MICDYCGKDTNENGGVCRNCGMPISPLHSGNGFYDIFSGGKPVPTYPHPAQDALKPSSERPKEPHRKRKNNIAVPLMLILSLAAFIVGIVSLNVSLSNKPDEAEQKKALTEIVEEILNEKRQQETEHPTEPQETDPSTEPSATDTNGKKLSDENTSEQKEKKKSSASSQSSKNETKAEETTVPVIANNNEEQNNMR